MGKGPCQQLHNMIKRLEMHVSNGKQSNSLESGKNIELYRLVIQLLTTLLVGYIVLLQHASSRSMS